MQLTNKNVFVTGSSRGIGLAIAHKFAQLGANVVLNSRGAISEELLAEFSNYGVKVVPISGDVSDFADAKRMVDQAITELGSVDVLVNNAGITQDTLMLKMTEEDFEKVIKINLTGVINMSSVVGLMGNIGQANYAASKAGLIGFTKSVAREVANRNVRVNALAPGMIESDMTAVLSDKVKEATLAQIPMKHFGQAEHIADATVFLAGQDYLTGQVLAVDGGLSM